MSLPARPAAAADDPACRPRPFGQRLQLLLVLLVLPVAAVVIPTIFVTGFFGQRPKAKAPPARPTPAADVSGLGAALNRSADALLPTPAPLTPEPLAVRVRADHVATRAQKVASQAQALGGAATEGVSDPGEKHLFVDLPAGSADAFRRAVLDNAAPVAPTATPPVGAARDQLEVIVRPTADDE